MVSRNLFRNASVFVGLMGLVVTLASHGNAVIKVGGTILFMLVIVFGVVVTDPRLGKYFGTGDKGDFIVDT